MKTKLDKVNLPKHIAKALIGKDHTAAHRLIAGVFVMSVGVAISHIEFFHVFFEAVGFGVHGLGLVPFIESLLD